MNTNLSNDTKALLKYGVLYANLNQRQQAAVANWQPTEKQIAEYKRAGQL